MSKLTSVSMSDPVLRAAVLLREAVDILEDYAEAHGNVEDSQLVFMVAADVSKQRELLEAEMGLFL